MKDLKEQLLNELKNDRGFVMELQRVLCIDDLEDDLNLLKNMSLSQT